MPETNYDQTGGSLILFLRAGGERFRAAFSHVHVAQYTLLERASSHFLHPNEQRYFASLPAIRRMNSYLMGRYVAKKALSEILDNADYPRIEIVRGLFDQPIVQYPTAEAVGVSITHTTRFACAVAFPAVIPMAVDIEQIDEHRIETMRTQISPPELTEATRNGIDEAHACTIIWTAKEALSKALRCGMTCPFDLLAIDRIETHCSPFTGTFLNFSQYKFQSWIGSGFVVTIVLPRTSQLETDLSPLVVRMGQS